MNETFLFVKNLKKTFNAQGLVVALDGVTFSLEKGHTLGILGESGCGKSTLAKLLLRLYPLDSGEIYFKGEAISCLKERGLRDFRNKVQIVFQEPFLSLDPRLKVIDTLKEPFLLRGARDKKFLEEKVDESLGLVELSLALKSRYPRELSGGECQRVVIARAISTDPELLVCDEPVSSVDKFTQAQLLQLFLKLKKKKGMSLIFISHDPQAIYHLSDEVMVMRQGKICEQGSRDQIFRGPQEVYTKALIENY